VTAAACDRRALSVVTGHQTGWLRVWSVQGGRPRAVQDLKPHQGTVRGVKLKAGRVLAWGDDQAVVQRLDGKKRPIVLRIVSDKGVVDLKDADLAPDGSRVVTAHGDGALRLWQSDGSSPPILLSKPHGGIWDQVTFSPDGGRILAVGSSGPEIWSSRPSGRPPLTLKGASDAKEGWSVAAFSPDGKLIAAGSFAGRVWVWPADGERDPKVLRSTGNLAQIGPISSLGFSRDGRRLVSTGGMDGRAYVWSLDHPESPVVIRQGGALTGADLSSDGLFAASASEMGNVLVSRVVWKDLVRYLRSLTSASLTVEQRIVFLGETENQARKAYEISERRFGRTPLPSEWSFEYPF
jgi:WD40 repeat protein